MKLILSIIACILCLSPLAQAKIYKWTDENGQVHFSDQPPAGEQPEMEQPFKDPLYQSQSSGDFAQLILGTWFIEQSQDLGNGQIMSIRLEMTYNADGTMFGSAETKGTIMELPIDFRGTWRIEDSNQLISKMESSMFGELVEEDSRETILSINQSTMVVTSQGEELTLKRAK